MNACGSELLFGSGGVVQAARAKQAEATWNGKMGPVSGVVPESMFYVYPNSKCKHISF